MGSLAAAEDPSRGFLSGRGGGCAEIGAVLDGGRVMGTQQVFVNNVAAHVDFRSRSSSRKVRSASAERERDSEVLSERRESRLRVRVRRVGVK